MGLVYLCLVLFGLFRLLAFLKVVDLLFEFCGGLLLFVGLLLGFLLGLRALLVFMGFPSFWVCVVELLSFLVVC